MEVQIFDLAGVLTLLGQGNVVTHTDNCVTFNQPLSKGQTVACPRMEQIQGCAKQNKAGGHKWMLSYASALSFQDQHMFLGSDKKYQPNYHKDASWCFLKPEEQEWIGSRPQPGYYLLDMMPHWNSLDWQEQEDNIALLGDDYERADERIFAQTVLTFQKITGRRLFNNAWHWGHTLDSVGRRVCVKLKLDGFFINDHEISGEHGSLSVCVARKSTHRAIINKPANCA